MTVDLKRNMKKTSSLKKRVTKKKIRSVPSLIAKNKKALQKLKPQESSDDSEALSDEDLDNVKDEVVSGDDGSASNEELDKEGDGDLLDDKTHKKSLAKLRDTDPEFYQFLEENDKKLLQFNVSDSESDGDPEKDEEKVHKPPIKLEVDSDEDDFTEGDAWAAGSGQLITLAMVADWRKQLQAQATVHLVTEVVKAFQAALQTVSGEEAAEHSDYRVDGSSVFNAVVQLCMLELQPALLKLLGLRSHTSDPARSKRWNKVKNVLKSYLTDLLKLLGAISSPNILNVLLKHLHQMTAFLGFYHTLTKVALKQLVALWSTSDEETVRVVAFLCILRLTTNQQKSLLDSVLKMMYVAYVSNSKFMSVSTLHNVTFMRRSLAEMFCLDHTVSYQHAFLYIRQLAIHLRNAITVHKKESIQAVCNWQYMNSLRLWVDLISCAGEASSLRALLYPLVQVTLGCIKLVPTAQYIPLRFHCCQLLSKLSLETATFIPVLPFIVESMFLLDFNKKFKKASLKPMDLTCVLRVNKAGLGENGLRDAIVEKVYELLIDYCAGESHRICFPDMIVPPMLELRRFVKECRTTKYSQKLRQALAKIEESGRLVEAERRKVALSLADTAAVGAWETNLRTRGTPLTVFHQSWQKVHQRQQAKQATNNDKLGDFKLPQIKRSVKKEEPEPSSGPVELFPSDSDDDDVGFGSDEEKPESKKKRTKKNKKKKVIVKKEEDEDSESDNMEDIVEELRLSDLE